MLLNELVHLHPKKLTVRDVESTHSDPLMNTVQRLGPASQQAFQRWIDMSWTHKTDVKKWPKPNVHMQQYEARPGVWLFTDGPTKIKFYVFSDEHRKNAFKGTSIEAVIPPELDPKTAEGMAKEVLDHMFAKVLHRLFDKLEELGK